LNLLQGLQRRGIRATLFAAPGSVLLARAGEAGLPAQAIPVRDIKRARLARPELLSVLSSASVDLIHAHDSGALTLAGRCGKKLGIPVVLSRRVASPLRRNPFSRVKYSGRNVAAVLAISETVKSVFAASGYPAERIHVVQSGLDLEALASVEADAALRASVGGRYTVAGVGKLSVKKNWQMLVRAAAALSAEGLDIQWLVAGEGPQRARLEELAARLDVADRVHLLGFRTDCDRILKTCDLLFFPSLVEGASVTVRQAMALGTPVVAVNAAGTAESLAGHGWLVSPNDVVAAARCVREALTDEARRGTAIAAARTSAHERFSLDTTVEGTLSVYRHVVKT